MTIRRTIEDLSTYHGQKYEHPAASEQDVAEHRQLVPQALLGEEEVELRIAGRPAHDEVVRAGDRLTLVAELPAANDPPQARRHLFRLEEEFRGEGLIAGEADRLGTAGSGVGAEQLLRVRHVALSKLVA